MAVDPEQGAPLEREVRPHAASACSIAVDCSTGKVSSREYEKRRRKIG